MAKKGKDQKKKKSASNDMQSKKKSAISQSPVSKAKSSNKNKHSKKKATSKMTVSKAKINDVPRDAAALNARVEVNLQGLNQIIEMVETVDPANINLESQRDLRKIFELVRQVQKEAVLIRRKKGTSAILTTNAPTNKESQNEGTPKSPTPKEQPKEDGTSLPPNEVAKAGEEMGKEEADKPCEPKIN